MWMDVDRAVGSQESQTPAEEKCEGKGVPQEADKERSVNAQRTRETRKTRGLRDSTGLLPRAAWVPGYFQLHFSPLIT